MPTIANGSNIHYVKFVRGPLVAWEKLQLTPEKISNDTLYFIYEDALNSKDGQLFLGQKLISGKSDSDSQKINLNDIGDIYIDDETLANKQILVYNAISGFWENTNLSTIINTAIGIMEGATAYEEGVSGLVPVPAAGDQDKFLKGSGEWATINLPKFDTNIFTTSLNEEITLNNFGLAEVGSIPIKTDDGLEWTTQVVNNFNIQITTLEKLKAQIAGTDPDPIDLNAVYLVNKKDIYSLNNQYDKYIVVNNRLERLGDFEEVVLDNYVQIPTFNTAIGNLNDILQDTIDEDTGVEIPGLISRISAVELHLGNFRDLSLSDGNTTLVEEVNTLSQRLKWHQLNSN